MVSRALIRHYRPTLRPVSNCMDSPRYFVVLVIFPTTFIVKNACVLTCTIQSTRSTVAHLPYLLSTSDITWPHLSKQMAIHASHRTSIVLPPPNSVQSQHPILFLIIGGVDINSGLPSSVNLTFGMLNTSGQQGNITPFRNSHMSLLLNCLLYTPV